MQPDNKVWMSREEYDRLRHHSQAPAPQPSPPQPAVYATQSDKPPEDVRPIQAGIGILLVIGLYVSLTVPIARFITIPILAVMLIFAAMSLNDFLKSQRRLTANHSSNLPANSSVEPVVTSAGQLSNTTFKKYKTLMIILICLLAAPVVFIAGMIIILIIAFSTGGAHFG